MGDLSRAGCRYVLKAHFHLVNSLIILHSLERAIREFEALSDVISSWNSETNILIIRRTTLAPILSVYARPSANPIAKSAFVHVELKLGKWAKRYLEVKNGAVLHSKSENVGPAFCYFTVRFAYFLYHRERIQPWSVSYRPSTRSLSPSILSKRSDRPNLSSLL